MDGKRQKVVEHKPRMISEMAIGEKGFCSAQSLYGGPALPVLGHDAQVSGMSLMTRTFLLDSQVYPEASEQATLYVQRELIGFYVRLPVDATTVKFRRNHPPNPLPVVGTDLQ